jgi:hypothetical protein
MGNYSTFGLSRSLVVSWIIGGSFDEANSTAFRQSTRRTANVAPAQDNELTKVPAAAVG